MNYVNIISEDKAKYTFPNVLKGVKQLEDGQTIMHAMDGMLRGAYKSNPKEFPDMKPFGYTRPKYFAMELNKNSPLTPMFTIGMTKIFERGSYDRLSVAWQGAPLSYSGAVEIMVLSGGQVILVFAILLSLLGISFFFLVGELFHKKFQSVKDWYVWQLNNKQEYRLEEDVKDPNDKEIWNKDYIWN